MGGRKKDGQKGVRHMYAINSLTSKCHETCWGLLEIHLETPREYKHVV